MNFKTSNDLINFLKYHCVRLNDGSQGIAYYCKLDRYVYKIFHEFFYDEVFDEYEKGDILRFNNIINDTFIWANDIITVNNNLVGYKMPYVRGKSLHTLNPLTVDLDHFISVIKRAREGIQIITQNNILVYDVMYNMLYSDKLTVIDTLDYSVSDLDYKDLFNNNRIRFDLEIYLFLIDCYFDEFINEYKDLQLIYCEKKENVLIFLELFRKYLSEYVGKDIMKLSDAKECMNKRKHKMLYQRCISNNPLS